MRKTYALALAAVLFVGTAAGVVANPSGKDGLDTPKFDLALTRQEGGARTLRDAGRPTS